MRIAYVLKREDLEASVRILAHAIPAYQAHQVARLAGARFFGMELDRAKNAAELELEAAKKEYKDAYDMGDSDLILAAQEKLKQSDQRLREANQVCTEITRDVEGLLHLRAQQLAEHTDEVARQQQIVLDEVVMRQWSLRDAEATA